MCEGTAAAGNIRESWRWEVGDEILRVVSRVSSGSHILCNRPGNTYTCLQLDFRGHNSVKKTVFFFQKTKTCHPAGASTAVLSIMS